MEVTDEKLDSIVDELKTFLTEAKIPGTYKVNIYKDQVNCCGHFPLGVAVEIQGPKVQSMKNVDETILCKIMEICGRENIKYHECSPMEIIQNLNGSYFIQG
jgi:hypothetical protein